MFRNSFSFKYTEIRLPLIAHINTMAKTDYKSIDEYHKAFPEEIQKRLKAIRDIVHKVAPAAEEVISYQIPAFKYNGFLIYYAAFTNHVTISNPWSQALLKKFEKELSDLKVSKSVIQFPNTAELPVDLITRIVEFRKFENETKSKVRGNL